MSKFDPNKFDEELDSQYIYYAESDTAPFEDNRNRITKGQEDMSGLVVCFSKKDTIFTNRVAGHS